MRSSAFLGLAIGLIASLGVSTAVPVNVIGADKGSMLLPQQPVISKTTKRQRKTTVFRPNGKREVARRLRQIAAGQLTRSNGLVTAAELYGNAKAA